jgi:hypothetical protein
MTPKEKARNLVMKYWKLNYDWDGCTKDEWAKEGALIAVDEIMNVIIGSYDYELEKIYWQDVKNEIELL